MNESSLTASIYFMSPGGNYLIIAAKFFPASAGEACRLRCAWEGY
jgi:hypothetical protein